MHRLFVLLTGGAYAHGADKPEPDVCDGERALP